MSAKSRGWADPPPVMVVSGSWEYMRGRELRKAAMAARISGRRVMDIAAGDSQGLREALSGGFLFEDPLLVLVGSSVLKKRKGRGKGEEVDSWSEEDLELVLTHGKEKSSDICLVVHHDGEAAGTTFAGKVAAAVPKNRHIVFETPKPWQMKSVAAQYLVEELKHRGKILSEALAAAVVNHVGTDFGLISFEALKISKYLDSVGRTEVVQEDLGGLVVNLGLEDWQALQDAVASKSVRAISRSCKELRNGPAGDAVVRACVRIEGALSRWLHTRALLEEEGVEGDDAAPRVGVHVYRHQKENVPAASRWSISALTSLINDLTEIERGAKRGHIDPWTWLESTLILACREDEHPPALPGL